MAKHSNELQWEQIKPDFSSSNQMQAIGNQSLSNAGDIFHKAASYFQQENNRLQKDREMLVKERDDAFARVGSAMSKKAFSDSLEVTTLPDGSVRHIFNEDKYAQSLEQQGLENGFYNLTDEDKYRVLNSISSETHAQLGIANNQANAQNAIDRERLKIERERIRKNERADFIKDIPNLAGYVLNYALSGSNDPRQKNNLLTSVRHAKQQLGENHPYYNSLDNMEQDLSNPNSDLWFLASKKDPNLLHSYVGGRFGMTPTQLQNNMGYVLTSQDITEQQNKAQMINDMNTGATYNDFILNLKSTNKLDNVEDMNATYAVPLYNALLQMYGGNKDNANKAMTQFINVNSKDKIASFKKSPEKIVNSILNNDTLNGDVGEYINISQDEYSNLRDYLKQQLNINNNNNNNSQPITPNTPPSKNWKPDIENTPTYRQYKVTPKNILNAGGDLFPLKDTIKTPEGYKEFTSLAENTVLSKNNTEHIDNFINKYNINYGKNSNNTKTRFINITNKTNNSSLILEYLLSKKPNRYKYKGRNEINGALLLQDYQYTIKALNTFKSKGK